MPPLAGADFTAPLNTRSNLGPATETPPSSGLFQFTDHFVSNYRQRFFRMSMATLAVWLGKSNSLAQGWRN
jgi:hypothetical protein